MTRLSGAYPHLRAALWLRLALSLEFRRKKTSSTAGSYRYKCGCVSVALSLSLFNECMYHFCKVQIQWWMRYCCTLAITFPLVHASLYGQSRRHHRAVDSAPPALRADSIIDHSSALVFPFYNQCVVRRRQHGIAAALWALQHAIRPRHGLDALDDALFQRWLAIRDDG